MHRIRRVQAIEPEVLIHRVRAGGVVGGGVGGAAVIHASG